MAGRAVKTINNQLVSVDAGGSGFANPHAHKIIFNPDCEFIVTFVLVAHSSGYTHLLLLVTQHHAAQTFVIQVCLPPQRNVQKAQEHQRRPPQHRSASTPIVEVAIQRQAPPSRKAAAIYGSKSRVPKGEENYNFLYIVKDIKDGGSFAVIEYEGKYVEDGGADFKMFPVTDDSDYEIEDYRVALIKEDHELYNHYSQ